MESTGWRDLVVRLPAKQHNRLMVMTSGGTEILIQEISRIQPEYLVIKGRVSGTSDAGRLYFVPFDQISFVGLSKMVMDEEIEEIFGGPAPQLVAAPAPVPAAPAVAVAVETPTEEPTEEIPVPAQEEESLEPALSPRTAITPTKFPNRAELLERIRSRSQPVVPKPPK
jgi:hypothetical protein